MRSRRRWGFARRGAGFAALATSLTITPALAQVGTGSVMLPPAEATSSVQFSRPTSIRELADGRVLVADRLERRLVLLRADLSGEVADIGRMGQGPGEFASVHLLHPLGGDTTLLTDPQGGRWHLAGPEGMLGSIGPRSRGVRLLGNNLSGTDSLGGVLGVQGYSPDSPDMASGRLADSLLLLLVSRASAEVDTVARLKGQGFRPPEVRRPSNRPMMLVTGNPLHSEDQALLFPDGWIAVAYVEPYRVSWRSPGAEWTRGPTYEVERVRVTEGERCFALARYVGSHIPCDPTLTPGWPEFAPPFVFTRTFPDLFAAPRGSLVIKRTPTSLAPDARYDVFNRLGERTGTLALREGQRILGFGESSVYIVTRDPRTDLHTLSRHPWPIR